MKAETLRAKTKKYLELENISIRKLALNANIDFTTLSRFLREERELTPQAMRRLRRAIDPNGSDMALHAAEIFKKYKRQAYSIADIVLLGENIVKLGKVLGQSESNSLQQDATL